jgi:predicted small metal-binding protein
MARRTIDCRTIPSDSNCTVVISGEENEVMELAAAHAVATHGHTDDATLRDGLREAMRDEEVLQADEGSFVQVVEFHTRDLDRFLTLGEQWRDEIGKEATARWALVTADRDRPDTFMELVGFPDYASAMRNSEHPVTTGFAKDLQEATDGEASFRNLDVKAIMRM